MIAIVGGGTGFLFISRAAGMVLRAVLTHHPAVSVSNCRITSRTKSGGEIETWLVRGVIWLYNNLS